MNDRIAKLVEGDEETKDWNEKVTEEDRNCFVNRPKGTQYVLLHLQLHSSAFFLLF
ncbi:hypothetical protein M1146_08285 [Patescibacteria group bacterium]|nr:hypothetical protein [Patescibacteria group bacterium]